MTRRRASPTAIIVPRYARPRGSDQRNMTDATRIGHSATNGTAALGGRHDRTRAARHRRRAGDRPDLPPRLDLPDFAAFPLLGDDRGRDCSTELLRGVRPIAERAGVGLLLETPTWRANTDWAARLGTTPPPWRRSTATRSTFLRALGERWSDRLPATRVSGQIGPRGDGYRARCRGRPRRGRRLPPPAARRVRRGRRRPCHRPDADRRRRGARRRRARRGTSACPWRSRSRSRPTAGCPAAPPWPRRSARSTPPAGRRTSWSTARTPTRRARAGHGRALARADPRPARRTPRR